MEGERRRRNAWVALLLLLLLVALLLLRCRCAEREPVATERAAGAATTPPARPAEAPPGAEEPAEVLGPATLAAPPEVRAGARFTVHWTGPDNAGDFVTIVPAGAADAAFASYRETKEGAELELVAPVEHGACELRYVTGRSHTVLARSPLAVTAAAATLAAPQAIELGKPVTIAWTGPDDPGDYVTIVMQGAPDEEYGDYAETARGSPLSVTAPATPGAAEVRYVTGQGRRVLARAPLRILDAEVSLSAPDEALAGATISVAWTGPDNAGDYVTIVAPGAGDTQYGNYAETRAGSPLSLLMPVAEGEHELRYVAGQGRVLARRSIRLVPAQVTLAAPDQVAAGGSFTVAWTGPAHSGDYLTIVPAGADDAQYGSYSDVSAGSPAELTAPKEAGDAEVRYVAGQGRKVLARRPIAVTP
jgi:Ca-activated chloride channel family protein